MGLVFFYEVLLLKQMITIINYMLCCNDIGRDPSNFKASKVANDNRKGVIWQLLGLFVCYGEQIT